MSRMLSALRVLERRPRTPSGGIGVGASQPGPSEAGSPVATETPSECDRDLQRLDADLSRASSLLDEFLADELLEVTAAVQSADAAVAIDLGDSRSVADAQAGTPKPALRRAEADFRAALPVEEIPPIEPAPAYRKLAWRIAHDAGGRDPRGPLLFVAVRGAAMDALNLVELAVALGEASDEVLLIDCRRNSPQGTIDAPPTLHPGLNQLVSDQAKWSDVIRPTSLRGISFVGAGEPEPLEPRWELGAVTIWQQLPHRGRQVLVGGGEFNRPLTLALAGCCQSTYLVVELGKERKNAVAQALEALRAAGARVCGAIAVDAARRRP